MRKLYCEASDQEKKKLVAIKSLDTLHKKALRYEGIAQGHHSGFSSRVLVQIFWLIQQLTCHNLAFQTSLVTLKSATLGHVTHRSLLI